ncbi:hypothetical protein BGM19_26910 [Streptomyces agglomeratus]|uniref:hypothetical protein n=1 Tax=Streptomyces agglomeratus TaxID=285458 RepID=UPI00086CA130|nr:hypothetical protein [Streptomyces agglomeratus]OEJ61106.1 hypothetical protein BGM19_26910 [Streptomyces agglomeratus]
MKFDMGSTTLSELGRQTTGSSDDLGGLVKQLIAAAAPLEGKFNGAGRAVFDSFKENTDEITAALNGSLQSILGGQAGMGTAFDSGVQEQTDNANQQMSAANFDAARFGAR